MNIVASSQEGGNKAMNMVVLKAFLWGGNKGWTMPYSAALFLTLWKGKKTFVRIYSKQHTLYASDNMGETEWAMDYWAS